jgi:GxxExxY protein
MNTDQERGSDRDAFLIFVFKIRGIRVIRGKTIFLFWSLIMAIKHEELTGKIISVFYEVYNELGHGFLESVYENSLRFALADAGLLVPLKQELVVWFRGREVGRFVPDIVVDSLVILEIKAARAIDPAHEAQLLNYLRATEVEVGLLLNFGPEPQFKRMVFDNHRKKNLNVVKRQE